VIDLKHTVKYAIVIPDGAADEPIAELHGLTPLEAADTTNLDWLAVNGRCGTVSLTPPRQPLAMEAAMAAMLGCDPQENSVAAGPLMAAGLHLPTDPTDWIFLCSLVTIVDGVLIDPLGGGISTREASRLIDLLNKEFGAAEFRFICGQDWRHLMVTGREISVRTFPPHSFVGESVANAAPRGRDSRQINDILRAAHELFADHEINAVRRDLGESPVTDIWLWGAGQTKPLPDFREQFGLTVAAVATDPLVCGLAGRMGWKVVDVRCQDGYTTADLDEMAAAAVALLDDCDLVCVHTACADRAGLAGDPAAKVASIEAIDRQIVGPILRRLRDEPDGWRMLVAPTHATLCGSRQRIGGPVPFAVSGLGVEALIRQPYTERIAEESDLHIARGHQLMEYFLTVR